MVLIVTILSPSPWRAQGTPDKSGDPVLVGAGDIHASCGTFGDQATARLLDNVLAAAGTAGTVFTAGDNIFLFGTAAEYHICYDPAWGRFKDRTYPTPGNHEYETPGAGPYYAYFGVRAGPLRKGYYSYNLGAWHIIAINSNFVSPEGSDQERWLRADLAANKAACILAYWHYPLFSSGIHGNDPQMRAIWRDLYAFGASIVINGHDHDYERFAPQTPDGQPDPVRGIREFVVGTGGGGLRDFGAIQPNSEKRGSHTWGVLKLTLHPTGYDWEFVPVDDQTFRDSGSAACAATAPTRAWAKS